MGHFSRLNPFATPAAGQAASKETPNAKARPTETTSNHTPKILKDWTVPCSPLSSTSKPQFDSPPERPLPPPTSLYQDTSISMYEDFNTAMASPSSARPSPTARFLAQESVRSNLPQSPSIKSLNSRLNKKSSNSPSIFKSSSIADLRSAAKGKSKAEITLESAVEEEVDGEEEGEDRSGEKKQRKRSGSLKDMMKAFGRRLSSGERDHPSGPNFSHPSEPVPNIPASLRAPNVPHSNSIASFSALERDDFSPPNAEEAINLGTPGGTGHLFKKGILRELQTPGSGHSVRFFSRDQFKIITPNTTADMSWANALEDGGAQADISVDETPLEGIETDAEHVGIGKPSFLTRLQTISGPEAMQDASTSSDSASQRARQITGSLRRDYIFPVDDSAHVGSVFGVGAGTSQHASPSGRNGSVMNMNLSTVDMGMIGQGMEDMSNLMDASNPFISLRARGSEATLRAPVSSHSDGSSDLFEFCDSGRTPRPPHDAFVAEHSPSIPVNNRNSISSLTSTQHNRDSHILGVPGLSDEANASYWSADSSDGRSSRPSLDGNASDASSQRSTGTMVVHEGSSSADHQDRRPSDATISDNGQSSMNNNSPQKSFRGTEEVLQSPSVAATSPPRSQGTFDYSNASRAEVSIGATATRYPSSISEAKASAEPVTPARNEKTVYLTPMNTLGDIMPRFSPMSDVDSSPSRSGSSCHSPMDLSGALRSMADTVSAAQSEHVEMVVRSRDQYQALCEKLKGKIIDLKDAGKKAQQEIAQLRRVVRDTTTSEASQAEKVQSVQDQFSSLENQIEASLNAAMWESVEDMGSLSQKPDTADALVIAQLDQARLELKDSAIKIEAMYREQMQSEDRAIRWENKHSLVQRRAHDLEKANGDLLQRSRDLEIRSRAILAPTESSADMEAHQEIARLKEMLREQAESHAHRERELVEDVEALEGQVDLQKGIITARETAIEEAAVAYSALEQRHSETVKEHAQIQHMMEISHDAIKDSRDAELDQLQARLASALDQERKALTLATDLEATVSDLTAQLRSKGQALATAEDQFRELHAELVGLEDAFADQASSHKRELHDVRQELQRQFDALRDHDAESAAYGKDLALALQNVAVAEAAKVEFISLRESLESEIDSLRRQNAQLRQDTAAKDLKILQLSKTKEQLMDDKEMLNIALDSKQQEVEIFKRRCSVKAGSSATPSSLRPVSYPSENSLVTPAYNRQSVSGMQSRRDLGASRASTAYQTPAPAARNLVRKNSASTPMPSGSIKARQPLGTSVRDNPRGSPARKRPVSGSISVTAGETPKLDRRNSRASENDISALPATPNSFKAVARTPSSELAF